MRGARGFGAFRAVTRHPDPCGSQRPDDRRGLCACRAWADADLRRPAHHQFRARRAVECCFVCGLLRVPPARPRPLCRRLPAGARVLHLRLRLAAIRHRPRLAWRRPQYAAGDAGSCGRDRERAALRVPRRHAHHRSALCLRDHRCRRHVSGGASSRRLCRRVRRRARALADHELHRCRPRDPRRRQGEARRRTRRHRRGACLRRHLRSRHRLHCDCRLPADPDLLRQPDGGRGLRPRRLHHRRARRHGLGAGRADRRVADRRGGKPVRTFSRRSAGPERQNPDLHRRAVGAAERSVRSACMRALAPIFVVVAALAAVPLVVSSNVVLNFLVVALLIALAGQGWNILGGYGGQYSFGHAAFFGTGAYVTAVLQVRYGVNAWPAFAAGIASGAALGALIGALTFRSGLRGSYFALVTLAFAEVLRIVASVAPIPGAGVGTLVKLDLRVEAMQFQSRAVFYWIVLALVAASLVIARLIERSRFGVWLVAVRENEDAARALGVDATQVKLAAMVISGAVTAAAGCFYVQYFLFIDAPIAYGTWISVEALLTPIIGGVGTVFGPLLGALVVKSLGEAAKLITGDAPGLDLIVYGAVLVLVIWLLPRGLIGGLAQARKRLRRRAPAAAVTAEAGHG